MRGNQTNGTGSGASTIDGGAGFNTAYTDPGDTVTNIQNLNPDQPAKLHGATIGTAGSYRNHGTIIADVFDGNLTTFFDGPNASGDWVGLALTAPEVVTQVKFAPRNTFEARMVGGEIQASNSANFTSGIVTLYTINAVPAAGGFTVAQISNTTAYSYYRYLGPANSYCDIAELEFDR